MNNTAVDWKDAIAPEFEPLVRIRQHLHANPELGFEEFQTSALVLRELEGLGLSIRTGLAKGTGIVAVLKGTGPGADSSAARSLALRGDMDCLPIQEETGLPYASTRPGLMHACGHDGHTTMLLGAARVLARHRDRLAGNVVFCFQPAEEGGGGGRYMVEEGALDDPPCSAVFALHGIPNMPLGTIGVRTGVSHAATGRFRIVIHGRGGHGAAPHNAVDPILMGARVVESLQSIVSREVHPLDSAVVTVGAIHAGNAANVIPSTLEMIGTIRALGPELKQRVEQAIVRIAEGVCQAAGGRAEVTITDGYPPLVNDATAAGLASRVAERVVGKEQVLQMPNPTMGGEDFAYFTQKVPGAMLRLGVATRHPYPDLHNPAFNFPDEATPIGVEIFCRLAETFLAEGFPK